jgi:TonB family protein
MLENPLSAPAAPERDVAARRDRAVGLLVTAVFHALLGLLVYYGRLTVKILPEREEVRTVVIVPPLKVALPKVVGGRGLAEVPGGPAAGPAGPAPADKRPAAAEPRQEEEGGEPSGAAVTGGPEPGWILPPPGSGAAIPSLSSKFQRSITTHGRSDLTIPLAPPGTPAGPPGIGGGAPLPDFSKYSRGVYGGVGGYGSGAGGGTGTGTGGRQRVGMSIPLKGYDLLPWATAVIDRLQVNWTLPAVGGVPKAAKIGMIVVIKKNGELDSIEIIEGTSLEALDKAALEALRTSLPFPPLPADFPGDLLEITFEFVYND